MTDDQINIECAKLDGKCLAPKGFDEDNECRKCRKKGINPVHDIADYTTSYDAVIPLMFRTGWEAFIINLNTTPKDLCIALLKAKGLYHE